MIYRKAIKLGAYDVVGECEQEAHCKLVNEPTQHSIDNKEESVAMNGLADKND